MDTTKINYPSLYLYSIQFNNVLVDINTIKIYYLSFEYSVIIVSLLKPYSVRVSRLYYETFCVKDKYTCQLL